MLPRIRPPKGRAAKRPLSPREPQGGCGLHHCHREEGALPHYERADWAKGYDVIIHDECTSAAIEPAYIAHVLAPHRAGLPAVNLHCAIHSYRTATTSDSSSAASNRAVMARSPIVVNVLDTSHPTMRGVPVWTTGNEELYNNVKVFPTATPLMQGVQKTPKGEDTAVVTWTILYRAKARVFSTTLGHTTATVSDPHYLNLVTRGVLWPVTNCATTARPPPATPR